MAEEVIKEISKEEEAELASWCKAMMILSLQERGA